MAKTRAFVMPEDEWFKLCDQACQLRCKEWGDDPDYCVEHNGICPECASDAARAVPAKYRTTEQHAETFGPRRDWRLYVGDILTATIIVRDDGSTGCRLSFGASVKFEDGKNAVLMAIGALRDQLQDSGTCPAARSARRSEVDSTTLISVADRIPLSTGFHAEPGETSAHLHNVYTDKDVGENERIWVGELTKDAVDAWRETEANLCWLEDLCGNVEVKAAGRLLNGELCDAMPELRHG